MKYPIKHRVTGDVLFTAYIDCGADVPDSMKKRMAVEWALIKGVSLRCTDLSYANLQGANLNRVDLSHADLSYANLSFAFLYTTDLSFADLSYVDLDYADLKDAKLDYQIQEGLIEEIAETVLNDTALLDMEKWHSECDTTHCVAGFACHINQVAKELERTHGTQIAALITLGPDAHSRFFDPKESTIDWLKTKVIK